jgi:hypothetical protein
VENAAQLRTWIVLEELSQYFEAKSNNIDSNCKHKTEIQHKSGSTRNHNKNMNLNVKWINTNLNLKSLNLTMKCVSCCLPLVLQVFVCFLICPLACLLNFAQTAQPCAS